MNIMLPDLSKHFLERETKAQRWFPMGPTEKSDSKAELGLKSFQLPSVVYNTRNFGGKTLTLKSKKLLSKIHSFFMLH